MKVGAVNKLVTVVVPPSYLNNWKSPTLGVVSNASAEVMLCSVILYCVYKFPAVNDVPPFVASRL